VTDVAVMIVDGGEAIADVDVLRHQSPLLGPVASKVAETDLGAVVVLDVDATIVVAHSEKESATPTFEGSFGFHPIAVWCDNTTEMLAARLRPGKARPDPTPPPNTLTCWPRRSPRSLVRTEGIAWSVPIARGPLTACWTG
jgi:hypothetical protein